MIGERGTQLEEIAMATAIAERAASGDERLKPETVGADVAAKMAGVCRRTLDDLPPALTGKLKIGRRTLYHVETLRGYLASLVAKSERD